MNLKMNLITDPNPKLFQNTRLKSFYLPQTLDLKLCGLSLKSFRSSLRHYEETFCFLIQILPFGCDDRNLIQMSLDEISGIKKQNI